MTIIGGIISSFIVYIATLKLSGSAQEKIYKEKVKNANYEFLQSIKPMIIDKNYSNQDFLDSIARSLSQKYDVRKSDLMSIQNIVDYIVLEISQSYFLDNMQKQSHIGNLLSIKEKSKEKTNKDLKDPKSLPSQIAVLRKHGKTL